MKKVDVIIPVYRPEEKFAELLRRLRKQTVRPHRIILFNTEEKYWQEFIGRFPGIMEMDELRIFHVSKESFDHGGTRRRAVRESESPIFVMMTDDAIPKNARMIEQLIKPLEKEKIAVSYGRQLCGSRASVSELMARSFNYPSVPMVKTWKDRERLGIKTFFCSNVCAAYSRPVYNKLGGFISRAIFNEDMIFASKAIECGYGIAYAAKAEVIHSHHYSNLQQMKRNFDLGVSQAMHPEVFGVVSSESEGIRMILLSCKQLLESGNFLEVIPLLITGVWKYAGYQMGKHYRVLPKGIIIQLTMNREFWQKGK